MARLFPFRSETPAQDGTPRVVDLEGDDADAVFGALSSTTARQIYSRLDDEPGTPSDIADAIDSSIQNVRYHLENLEEAGLVEVVDTWYSSRGNEMSVYGTTDGPLIVTSDESTGSQLKTAISRLIGGIGALAGGSLLVQYGVTQWLGAGDPVTLEGPMPSAEDEGDAAPPPDGEREARGDEPAGADGDDGTSDDIDTDATGDIDDSVPDDADDDAGIASVEDDAEDAETEADEPVDDAVEDTDGPAEVQEEEAMDEPDDEYAMDVPDDDASTPGEQLDTEPTGDYAADGGAEAADAVVSSVPPGLLFFLGGLVVLLAVTAYWYWYRPTY
ncbi:winged helix-turn-helix transcriptional regulator [Salinadaptatus halalkaliphilus]|uniref:Winged helix-turn-helix transcriptional regulator n=1 Tax=Salinadaptatus halalkaliphilus TaxID=2419781 RepID=A0A4S3TMX6_9EURY|nr:helix-turn-helix domain-containing protein [Salinadaptatus halalkaliphilus]THE64563.1 winged helix-turn-helix transcriptional regulator [Salinadaptatus halalkaliphilus]